MFPRLFLYSAHDNTLLPLLNGFDVYDKQHPPMGSFISLELYSQPNSTSATTENNKHFVRFVYNGKEIQIPGKIFPVFIVLYSLIFILECQKFEEKGREGLCPFEHFKRIAKPLIPTNYEQECKVP